MAPPARHRRELLGLLALASGTFLALSLLPTGVTGPLGRAVGDVSWMYLGVGAALLPLLLLVLGISAFGRFAWLDMRRAAVLFGGLAFLLPFAVGVATGTGMTEPLPADYAAWTILQKWVGIVPALVADGVADAVGMGGAVILTLLSLSILTLHTLDWHPLRRLMRPAAGAGGEDMAVLVGAPEVARPRWKRLLGVSAAGPPRSPTAGEAPSEEQAFITGEAIEPFPLALLEEPRHERAAEDEAELDRLGHVLVETLETFGVEAGLGTHRSTGPVVTQFEVSPAAGVKVGRIAALADDLALKMEARSIRIVAPIPGKPFVGVEVPNPTPRVVMLRELLTPPTWDPQRPGLPIALGRDLEGRPVTADLTKMPHLLIAGATGSGKSVCINTIVTGLVHRYTERELRMLMIDPKMVELTAYNALPHLIYPVVTNNREAAKALKWAMYEMEDRYELFSANNVRNLHEFNRKVRDGKPVVTARPPEESDAPGGGGSAGAAPALVPYTGSTLPYVVIVVDELADLMMTVQGEVEKPLATLAQKARATGIHLVLSTQRPSVNVITGLIKANFPSRIAFRVASKVDSRTILDQNGAESLLGNGDMLFLPPGRSEPIRVQGAFISTDETERVTEWYRRRLDGGPVAPGEVTWATRAETEDIMAVVQAREGREERLAAGGEGDTAERDPLFWEAAETCVQHHLGSTSLLQRKLRIGYGRAARIIDQLHEAGVLGPPDGSKPREILVGMAELEQMVARRG